MRISQADDRHGGVGLGMKKKTGERTGEFGCWLTKALQDCPEYQVYYDHGDPKRRENVAVIKAFVGDEVNRKNKLADVDIMVVNRDDEILLLIEVEESRIAPKTLLGDVFACLLSSGFSVNLQGEQRYFQVTPQTQLWVAGYIPNREEGKKDLIDQLGEKINRLAAKDVSIEIDSVKLLIENDLESCLKLLLEKSLEYLNGS